MGRKVGCLKKFLKLAVVAVCTIGFLMQTLEFMHLYWTYPTVVDIQVSIPSEIDLPGITICNPNGMFPLVICDMEGPCIPPAMLKFVDLCSIFPAVCKDGKTLAEGFRAIAYHKFMKEHQLNATSLKKLRMPLARYMTCKIVSDGRKRDCNIENAIYGSYYSDSYLPNFCFSINTLWSQPGQKREKIKKSERIQMEFNAGYSKGEVPPLDLKVYPKFNNPANPAIHIAIHSPYVTVSPYRAGQAFLGGKLYEIKLKQDEKHLLPPPYQTNCTDYMPAWRSRGGVGPLNQLMVIEECKFNASAKDDGCIPLSIDYPHNGSICKLCDECNSTAGVWDHCTDLLESYNQPCDFITYEMEVEEKVVYIEKSFKSKLYRGSESAIFREFGYNCTDNNILTRKCQTISVEIVFDNFEITNITYNPKFESLELFSVVGGYMGMYLGISIVAMYDFAEMIASAIYSFVQRRRAKKKKQRKMLKAKVFSNRLGYPSEYDYDFRRRPTVYSYKDKY